MKLCGLRLARRRTGRRLSALAFHLLFELREFIATWSGQRSQWRKRGDESEREQRFHGGYPVSCA
jgi:hypothetical protein